MGWMFKTWVAGYNSGISNMNGGKITRR